MAERMLPMAGKLASLVLHTQCLSPRPMHGLLAAALIVALASSGCRSSQTAAIPNPFLSADRVPAPASRIPAPGMAQPYYPGDAMPPLPATQPAMQPGFQPLGALPPSNDITPIPGDATFTDAMPPAAIESLASSDSVVRIPEDNSSMRFASAPQPPIELPPTATQAAQPTAPLQVAQNTPPAGLAPTPTMYREQQPTAPVISNWPPVAAPEPQVTMTPVVGGEATSGLFRDPSVPAQAPPLIQQAAPLQPTTAPRIRVPGSAERVREDVVPGSINTTSYQVGMAGGGVQTMVVPPPGYVPASLDGSESAEPPSDGFRPRGSARSAYGTTPGGSYIPTLSVTPG